MRTTRSSKEYQDYLAEQRREEQAQQSRAEAAEAQRQRPLLEAQAALAEVANREAAAMRERILTQRCDDLLPDLERIGEHEVDTDIAASNYKLWTKGTPSFRQEFSTVFLSILELNDLAPVARNFEPLHALLLEYACYPEIAIPASATAAPSVKREPTYGERSAQARHDYMTKVVIVHDGVKYTEKMLDDLPARVALHIRRISEHGHSGGAAYNEWLDTQNEIEKRQREVARLAAEELGGQ